MAFKVWADGALRTITAVKVMVGGTLRVAKTVKAQESGNLRTVAAFASPMSLSASPTSAFGEDFAGVPVVVFSDTVTAIPSGGLGPYTYAWTIIAGTGFTVTAPSNASTSFSATVNSPGGKTGTARCTCTDSFGTTATVDVPIQLQNGLGS